MTKPIKINATALDAAVDAGAIDAAYGTATYEQQLAKAIRAYITAAKTTKGNTKS